jgi:hypothetical protein
MIVFWRVTYADRSDRQLKHRDLILNTDRLSPDVKAAVELAIEFRELRPHELLKYRSLFKEGSVHEIDEDDFGIEVKNHCFCLPDYMEDESGKMISGDEMAQIVTGCPTVRMIPSGAQQHDIDFMLSMPQPMPVAKVSLSPEEAKLLGYFSRDLRELAESAFMRDGPGSLTSSTPKRTNDPVLTTAASDDEIRSFVTIFRRLYMDKEPASFQKAVTLFDKAVGTTPHGEWVIATAKAHKDKLDKAVDPRPFMATCSFTRKRVIDIFIYTRYSHQPSEERQRQYQQCLAEVGNSTDMLMWIFLTELWKSSLEIVCAGKVIVGWFDKYCAHHGLTPDVLRSVAHDNPGIGTQEKEAHRQQRLFAEKVEEVSKAIWKERGSPAGGHHQFLQEAESMLRKAMG